MSRFLKVLIFVFQITTIHAIAFNFKRNKFEKSKFLQVYSSMVSSIVFTLFLCCFVIFKNLLSRQSYVDVANIYCLVVLFSTCMALILSMLYQALFKTEKLVEISNEMLAMCDITKSQAIQVIACITLISFFIMPTISYGVLMSYYKNESDKVWLCLVILFMSYIWCTLSVYPFIFQQYLILTLMRQIKTKVCDVVRQINQENHDQFDVLRQLNNIIISHSHLAKILRKTVDYYQFNIVLVVTARSCNLIRKMYRLIDMWFFSSNRIDYVQQIMDITITIVSFLTIRVFLIIPSHHLMLEHKKIIQCIRKIRTNLVDKSVIETVGSIHNKLFDFV